MTLTTPTFVCVVCFSGLWNVLVVTFFLIICSALRRLSSCKTECGVLCVFLGYGTFLLCLFFFFCLWHLGRYLSCKTQCGVLYVFLISGTFLVFLYIVVLVVFFGRRNRRTPTSFSERRTWIDRAARLALRFGRLRLRQLRPPPQAAHAGWVILVCSEGRWTRGRDVNDGWVLWLLLSYSM